MEKERMCPPGVARQCLCEANIGRLLLELIVYVIVQLFHWTVLLILTNDVTHLPLQCHTENF